MHDMRKNILIVVILLILSRCLGAEALPPKFVKAIHQKETGGRTGRIMGDNGRALGPLQIHRVCFDDAQEIDSRLKGVKYAECEKLSVSIIVLEAYLWRYCRAAVKANDFETMARTWNGGPNGVKKNQTKIYWQGVERAMR